MYMYSTCSRSRWLTDNDSQDHQDYNDEDNPKFHILPPQFPLQSDSRTLEHVRILVQVLWRRDSNSTQLNLPAVSVTEATVCYVL